MKALRAVLSGVAITAAFMLVGYLLAGLPGQIVGMLVGWVTSVMAGFWIGLRT